MSRRPVPAPATLRRDARGAAAIEFAIVAPVFLSLLIGLGDLGQMVYGKSVLSGAVQQAARNATLETSDTSAADAMVESVVSTVLPGAEYASTRVSYFDFPDVGRAERWNDADGNGECDNGESFTDENRSGAWEADVGLSGNGGAGDVVVYTVTVRYSPTFRIPFLPDGWTEREISASTVRKNQPFSNQTEYASVAGVCA